MINKFRDQYAFLSNFFPCRIIHDGIFYPSVEHAYQAQKTMDKKEQYHIATLKTPMEAKTYGKHLIMRDDWEIVKLDIMERLLIVKFKAPCLRKMLLNTKDKELIEGNYWKDTYWGVDLKTNKGENNLGKLLMKIREFYGRMT
ncbi:NADAR family protein [Candidatus Pacearchaeota archaeon]|jgi:hypothetical protein|nr:NADAR family protein [bacterium]MCK9597140.1 NADAR family protein [Candidatus Pacearchaeota archaeon]